MKIEASHIYLNEDLRDKDAILEFIAGRLAERGCVGPSYKESMRERENQADTYLGHGIAIPHGTREDLHLVKKTGVVFLQLKKKIKWNGKDKVTLVMGMAAKDSDHMEILAGLTGVIQDKKLAKRLSKTRNILEVMNIINHGSAESKTSKDPHLNEMKVFQNAVVPATEPLHARPAHYFVQIAKKYKSDIRVSTGEKAANAKSIAQILQLGAMPGQSLRLGASGKDAREALLELADFLDRNYQTKEGKSGASVAHPDDEQEESEGDLHDSKKDSPVYTLGGHKYAGQSVEVNSVSRGVALGPLFTMPQHDENTVVETMEVKGSIEEEIILFEDTIKNVSRRLKELSDRFEKEHKQEQAEIFAAHIEIVTDEEIGQEVKTLIKNKKLSAVSAWKLIMGREREEIGSSGDALFAERRADFLDIENRVSAALLGKNYELRLPSYPVILATGELTPSDTIGLTPEKILGIINVFGGPTSHASIIARAMGVPAVVGGGQAFLDELADRSGTSVILDAFARTVVLEPDASDRETASKRAELYKKQLEEAKSKSKEPAVTKDGHAVLVEGNIAKPEGAESAAKNGADGIGLLRTEFLFFERSSAPSEDEQYRVYKKITDTMGSSPVCLRTLDIGGDKPIAYLNLPKEDNPFLGVRGIRLCFRLEELFETQLRAALRVAAEGGKIQIMFPMIAGLEEFRKAKHIVRKIGTELGAPSVPLGTMIELPSAIALLPELSREADFFSIGTNDLFQYLFGVDRTNNSPELQFYELHPALLRNIKEIVLKAGDKPVAVCGALGGNVEAIPLLIGLGVKTLSAPAALLPTVKALVRTLDYEKTKLMADQALRCSTGEEVKEILELYSRK